MAVGYEIAKKFCILFLGFIGVQLLFNVSGITASAADNGVALESKVSNDIEDNSNKNSRIPLPNIVFGRNVPNCGLQKLCSEDEFPVHLYTGKDNTKDLKLCIDGHIVLSKDINNGGRGLNVAVVDPSTKKILRVATFDVYEEGSLSLEIFLLNRHADDIIILFSHDDAFQKMTKMTKHMLTELGSSAIHNASFRDTWYMITQKGITGFTPFEKLNPKISAWGEAITVGLCIPKKIKGIEDIEFLPRSRNVEREKFCEKNYGYGDFCEASVVSDPLRPAILKDKLSSNNKIYQVPIAVLIGFSLFTVPKTLESILLQPGIKPEMVTMYYLPVFEEIPQLAKLFGFNTFKFENVTSYMEEVTVMMEETWKKFPESDFIIVIEDDLILGQGYLEYMAQMLPILEKDDTILAISAWNDNGFSEVSSISELAYRVESFPGFAFLLKKSFYEKEMKDNMMSCCSKRSWSGWMKDELNGREIIVPDVSRVYHRPYEGLGPDAIALDELFSRPRNLQMKKGAIIKNADKLTQDEYEEDIKETIKNSLNLRITINQLEECHQKSHTLVLPSAQKKTFVMYFQQTSINDYRVLEHLCKCFHLYSVDGYPIHGLHKGMLRFSKNGSQILLVGSASPYYNLKPSGIKVVDF